MREWVEKKSIVLPPRKLRSRRISNPLIQNPPPLSLSPPVEIPMPIRGARNPRNGKNKRRKTKDFSGDDAVHSNSDSDYIIDQEEEEEEEEEEVQEIPIPPPSPPPLLLPRIKRPPRKDKDGDKKGGDTLTWEILEEQQEKWVDDQESEIYHQSEYMAETVDPPSDIILPLLRFQKEWLSWALNQEKSEVRGGILADEMGMGKTIQAISLVLASRSLRSRQNSGMAACSSSSSSSPLPRTSATLVICPVVAVIQWVGEIEQHTERGSVRVLVYHGSKRSSIVYDFNNYDFVLTTYSTIESDFRKYIMSPKEKCQWCEKWLFPKKMKIHQKYFCGPDAQKTDLQSEQVKKKVGWVPEDGKSSGKKKGVRKKKNDESVGASQRSVLHCVKWERIILDEVIYFMLPLHVIFGRFPWNVLCSCGLCKNDLLVYRKCFFEPS